MGAVLLVLLILLVVGVLPREGGYTAGWGYYPAGGLGLVLLVVLVVILLGHVPVWF